MKKMLKRVFTILICMMMTCGGFVSVVKANVYPQSPPQDADGDGHSEIRCTYFAWQQVYDNQGISLPNWGNAGSWYDAAARAGYSVGTVPQPGAIAVWIGGAGNYGHVAYVVSVQSATSFTYNEGGNTHYDGNPEPGNGTRYNVQYNGGIGSVLGYSGGKTLKGFIYPSGSAPTLSLSWKNISATPSTDSANAIIYAELHSNISGYFSEAGITVWDEAGQVVGSKSEASSVNGTYMWMNFDLVNEVGASLANGSTYTYKVYGVFNGNRYESETGSFTTSGPKTNTWTQELSITDWTYGETASIPSAAAQYGDVIFTYSDSENGTYTAERPTNAGTYYVKASVSGSDQYTGLEAVKSFTIHKAIPTYVQPKDVTATYYLDKVLSDIELPDGFVWVNEDEPLSSVGERIYVVSYVPEDTNNYVSIDGIEVNVKIEPFDLSDLPLEEVDQNTDLDQYEIYFNDEALVRDVDYTLISKKEEDKVTINIEYIGNYTGSAQLSYVIKTVDVDSNTNTNQPSNETTPKSPSRNETTPNTNVANDTNAWMTSALLATGLFTIVYNKRKLNK